MDIVVLKLKEINKDLIYDYANNKLFLSEKVENDIISFSSYRIKSRAQISKLLLICLPFFLIIKDIKVPIIVYYVLPFYLKKFVNYFYLDPFKEKTKNNRWEVISYEQASTLVEDYNIIVPIGFMIFGILLGSLCYYSDYLEVQLLGIVTILLFLSGFLAMIKDWVISYKLVKKLKKL